jgi:uncharacterized membrane protein
MSSRFEQIDILRGSLFIPMFIFHLFSFYDLTNNFRTDYSSSPYIKYFGYVRTIYIILAGYSLYLSYKSNELKKDKSTIDFYKNRFKRSLIIGFFAFFISLLSHYLYPNYGIKFGILHFIAFSTLLVSPIAHLNLPIVTLFLLIVSCFWKIPSFGPIIDTITGARVHYSTADWFPLNKNLKYILFGLFISQIGNKYLPPYETKHIVGEAFKFMGKQSLELYNIHFIIIMVVYYILKNGINVK